MYGNITKTQRVAKRCFGNCLLSLAPSHIRNVNKGQCWFFFYKKVKVHASAYLLLKKYIVTLKHHYRIYKNTKHCYNNDK